MQQPVIFINYRRMDTAGHARSVHDRLKLWFDESLLFFDVESIDAGEVLPERIATALQAARVVLVLIGPDWLTELNRRASLLQPDYVHKELEFALRLQQAECPPKIIPLLLGGAAFDVLQAVPPSLARLADFNAHELPPNRHWDHAFVALRTLLASVPGVPAPRFRPPPGESRPFPRIDHVLSAHFHDPRAQLAKLRAALLDRCSAAIVARAALYGMGGVGKTQLAIKYAFEYRDAYAAGVWWLRAETETTLQLDARAACDEVGITPAQGELPSLAFRRWLERQSQGWLLILDNAETLDSLRPHLPQAGPHHVLITSRNPAWGSIAVPVELMVWSDEEGAGFLALRLPNQERRDLLQLSRVLGGLPLALEQAAGWVEATAGSIGEYCEQIQDVDTSAFVLDEGRVATGYERTVFATLSLAYKHLTEPARRLLRMCAFFGPEPIPERYFRQGREHLPEPLTQVITDPFSWARTIAELRRFGILERVYIASLGHAPAAFQPKQERALVLHRLTLEVARHAIGIEAEDGPQAQRLLHVQCPKDTESPESWPYFKALLPHIDSFERFRGQSWLHRRAYSELLNQFGRYLQFRQALCGESERLLREAIALDSTDLGEEHPDTLRSMNNLALTLFGKGDLTAARALEEKVLNTRRAVLGEEHPATLTSMNNLAATLLSQGHLNDARALQQKVLSIRGVVLGEEDSSTLTSMNNLAATLLAQGDLPGARRILEHVLAIRYRTVGDEHPDTLMSKNNLAETLQSQGDLAGARLLVEQMLSTMYRVFGREHPHTLTSINRLATILVRQGNLPGARQLHEDVLSIRHQVLGEEHPDTLVSMNSLAETLRIQGDSNAARVLAQRAWSIQRTVLGEEHPHTLGTIHNLAITLWSLDEHDAAVELMSAAAKGLQATVGADHPHTRSASQWLESWRVNLGKTK